ncbi:MAG: hypothetical protein IH889_00970, partial [Planctomycetes bacterium]|nr:hypothetical protein [Planctomycetota bacterium]
MARTTLVAAIGMAGILLVGTPAPSWSDPVLDSPDNGPSTSAQLVGQFLEAHPDTALYEWAGRISRVYGAAFSHGASAVDSAEQFRLNHVAMFGVDPAQLVPRGPFPDGHHLQPIMYEPATGQYKFTGVYYSQVKDGIAVFRSRLTLLVRNEPGFPLVLASADLRDLGDFEVPAQGARPVKVEPAVQEAVVSAVGPDAQFSEPQLVIWAGVDEMIVQPRLAMQFVATSGSIVQPQTYQQWLYLVDAETAEVLYREDQILNVDVAGNVSGLATQGIGADICDPEALEPMPYARVNIGATVAFADANGDFIIPNGGAGAVTVQSRVEGLWFNVNNIAGADTVLSQNVIPPGPANFVHNAANSSEFIRAEVNGYVEANVARDFVLTYNPAYPVINNQMDMDVNVNINDNCNAFYSIVEQSINFFTSGGGCPNTANSTVVHHEYGHHLVQVAGSGQGAYGEGMGDLIGVLITDQPILAIGFQNNCNAGLRTADNNLQYPCGGGIHFCGQLLSGCVWSTRNELLASNPSTYLEILSNLTVNSILLHNGSSITPSITIDFLTLDDDDGDIFNGTPHYTEINAGFSAHNMDAPELALLSFSFPQGLPEVITPAGGTTVPVVVEALTALPEPNTGVLHVDVGAGFVAIPMTEVVPNLYDAIFPAAECGTQVAFYFSAETTTGQEVVTPNGAPANSFAVLSATGLQVVLEDDFEGDTGWVVGAPGDDATTGIWNRMDPEGTAAQPENDHTPNPGSICWVTDGFAGGGLGTFDVDNGQTTLTSPVIDLLGATNAEISYWRWYSNDTGASPNADVFVVDISNNNGSTWTNVETVGPAGPETSGGWIFHQFNVADFVAPTAQVRVRFIASDEGSGSLVEAAVDDFTVIEVLCEPPPTADLNGDGCADSKDLTILLGAWCSAVNDPNPPSPPCENCTQANLD